MIQNLHTHSVFCDGKDTIEEMVIAAIDKGFKSIGFSGHQYTSYSQHYSMSSEGMLSYKAEIMRLKEKYKNQIEILYGIEAEIYSDASFSEYDYVIGSIHHLLIGGKYIEFDTNLMVVQQLIDNSFNGDAMKYAKAYYDALAKADFKHHNSIIGHFDIISKHSEKADFLNVNAEEYLQYAYQAIEALEGKVKYFEVNTGAIARGYRTTPYPSPKITKRLLERGFLPVITTDCHNKNDLDCAFEQAIYLLKICGAKEYYILTKQGFKAIEI